MSANSAITTLIAPAIMTDQAFSAEYTGAPVLLTANVRHQMICDDVKHTVGTGYDSILGVFTVPVNGIYNCKAMATLNNPTDQWIEGQNITIEIDILTAGPTYTVLTASRRKTNDSFVINTEYDVLISRDIRLTAGDDIVAVVRTNQSNKTFVTDLSYFECRRVGD